MAEPYTTTVTPSVDTQLLRSSERTPNQDGIPDKTGVPGSSPARHGHGGFWSTTKGRIVLILSILLALGLILGLSLGLTIGRKDSQGQGNKEGHEDGGVRRNWKKPEKMATNDGWFPSPRGGSDEQWREAYEKARGLVGRMSLLEKVNVTTGTGWSMGPCVGNTGTTNVGFPSLCLQDGPLGIRYAYPVTAFPAGITTAATFSKDLMLARGKALGLEARQLGINALLGPCIGPLGRSPLGGRNWEAFGADPYLQGVAAQLTVKGIQEQGVMAVVKHWLGNEQERFRRGDEARGQQKWRDVKESISSNIGGRAIRELYAWPFMDAIKEGAVGVMCSYNQVNNSYACQNSWLLNGLLKDELGFQGFVVSDWLAQRAGVDSVLAGMDMTMPGDGLVWSDGKSLLGGELTAAVVNGTIPLSRLDDMVLRIVASWYKLGQDSPDFLPPQGKPLFSSWFRDEIGSTYFGSGDPSGGMSVQNYFADPRGETIPGSTNPTNPTTNPSHGKLAREIAAEGIVLLKNMNATLPIPGNGMFRFRPFKEIAVFGTDAGHSPLGPNGCADRGCNKGTLGQGWGSGSVEYPYLVSPLEAIQARALQDGSTVTFVLEDGPTRRVNDTAGFIGKRSVDDAICLVFVSSDSGEGYIHSEGHMGDRNDLNLWYQGDEMILSVAERCRNTVVVIHSVGPVLMEKWADHPNVKSILLASLPGQESGTALVDVLWGDVNPSGHLPYTIGKSLQDYGPHARIEEEPNWEVPQVDFTEGVFVDYRWFDKKNITPRYEFGFGMSYTRFNFSDILITPLWPQQPQSKTIPETPPAPPLKNITFPDTFTNSTIPPREALLFPSSSFKSISRFVYPYLPTPSSSPSPSPSPYPYPRNYTSAPHRNLTSHPSSSGGNQGGPPSLFAPLFRVSVMVTNVGLYDGKAVAQLYLTYPNTTTSEKYGELPVRVLRGFEKVELKKGEGKIVEFVLTRRDVSVWDEGRGVWVVPREGGGGGGAGVGRYKVYVGPSPRGEERGVGVVGWTERVPGGE